MSKKPSPKSLPRIKKAELDKKTKLEEEKGTISQEREGTMWIIVFALAILIVFAILVWSFFSDRSVKTTSDEKNRLENTIDVEDAGEPSYGEE